MSEALLAEWTKQRTTLAAAALALATIVLTVGLSAIVALASHAGAAPSAQDLTKLSLTGIYLGQAVVAALAVASIGGEYATRMITVSLCAVPRRTTLLAAKAAVLSAIVLGAGLVAVLGSLLAGRLLLPAGGFTAAHGYPLVSLGHGPTLRAAVGTVIYLALIALLSLGIATTVRDAPVAIGVVLALLYVFPILAHLVGGPHLQRHLEQLGPMTAGLAIESTTHLRSLPISPWAGLGVLAAWAAAGLLTGGVALARRDA